MLTIAYVISLLFINERSDASTNRMVEALNLFKEITNNPIFFKTTTQEHR